MVLRTSVLKLDTAKLDGGAKPVIVWLLLNAIDTLTTHYIISNGGVELNLIYQLSHNMGVVVISKWACVVLVMGIMYWRKATKVLWAFSIIPLVAVLNNWWEILKVL